MDMKTQIDVEAPAADAWYVLADEFGDIAQWTSSLEASHLDRDTPEQGAMRTCMSPGFGPFPAGEVTEELTRFDAEALAFTYEARSGLPRFVSRALNHWTIEPLGPERCRVRSHATLELVWWARPFGPLMRWSMRAGLRTFVEELVHRIERGAPHPRVAPTARLQLE